MMTFRQQVPDIKLPLTSSWQIPNLGIYFENAYPRNFLAWAMPLNSSLGDELLTEGYPWQVSHYDFLTTWLPNAKLPHDNKFLTTSCQQRVSDEFLMCQWFLGSWKIPNLVIYLKMPTQKTFWRGPCLWIHRLAIVWKTNEASTLPEFIYHLWRGKMSGKPRDAPHHENVYTSEFWHFIIYIYLLAKHY